MIALSEIVSQALRLRPPTAMPVLNRDPFVVDDEEDNDHPPHQNNTNAHQVDDLVGPKPVIYYGEGPFDPPSSDEEADELLEKNNVAHNGIANGTLSPRIGIEEEGFLQVGQRKVCSRAHSQSRIQVPDWLSIYLTVSRDPLHCVFSLLHSPVSLAWQFSLAYMLRFRIEELLIASAARGISPWTMSSMARSTPTLSLSCGCRKVRLYRLSVLQQLITSLRMHFVLQSGRRRLRYLSGWLYQAHRSQDKHNQRPCLFL